MTNTNCTPQILTMKIISSFIPFIIATITYAQEPRQPDVWNANNDRYLILYQLPDWSYDFFDSGSLGSEYKLSLYINPFYLEGDFNADGILDVAALIEETATTKYGIVVCHGGTKEYFIIGAGKYVGNGGDDYRWMDLWKVYREPTIEPGVGETEIIPLKGQAIWVGKSESASAVIYWTGSEYKWYQQGD
jgi:hypothetical protein